MSSVSDSTSCWRSSTLSRSVAGRSGAPPPARAAGAQAAAIAHTHTRIRTSRISIDPLSRFVLTRAAGPVAADQREEHVVRVVPVAAIDVEGRPIAHGPSRRAVEVAESLVGVAQLRYGNPRDARLPLVEALGDRLEPLG